MQEFRSLLSSTALQPPLPQKPAVALATQLGELANLSVYWRSLTAAHQAVFFLGQAKQGPLGQKLLGILARAGCPALDAFTGSQSEAAIEGQSLSLLLCPTSYANALALHKAGRDADAEEAASQLIARGPESDAVVQQAVAFREALRQG